MFKIKFIIASLVLLLIIGCGSSSNPSIETRPSLNENNIVATANTEARISEDRISDNGAIKEDIPIVAQSEDGKVAVKTVISEGTTFQNTKGETLTTPPTISIVQKESIDKVVTEGKNTTKNVVKSEIKLTDDNGDKIIPTKPVKVNIKAPSGSKPGDKVRVDIPDGATVSKRNEANLEKIIVVTVGADGYVNVTILPEIFKNLTVIVIVIEKVTTIPITGGSGGN
jgi:hypothetical protein